MYSLHFWLVWSLKFKLLEVKFICYVIGLTVFEQYKLLNYIIIDYFNSLKLLIKHRVQDARSKTIGLGRQFSDAKEWFVPKEIHSK